MFPTFSSRLLIGAAVALALAVPALGDLLLTGVGGPANSYVGPGDIATFTGFYSPSRAYNSAAASNNLVMFKARKTSGGETCDVRSASNGTPGLTTGCSGASNNTAYGTFCPTTACTLVTLYNTAPGAAKDVTQGTVANQFGLSTSCVNGRNCVLLNNANFMSSASNYTPGSTTTSFWMVLIRTGLGNSNPIAENGFGTTGNRLNTVNGSANTWQLSNGTAAQFNISTATDGVWHTGVAIMAGASSCRWSIDNVDTTQSSGCPPGTTTAGVNAIGVGATVGTVNEAEAGFVDGVQLTAQQRTALCQNAQAFYGSGNFGTAC